MESTSKRQQLLTLKCHVPNEEFSVGWICAIESEFTASQMFLDEPLGHPRTQALHDNNTYQLGKIHEHFVVMTCLPAKYYGTDAAAAVARDMMSTFPNIRIGLMVGVAGGAPSRRHDVRLGDVVVSFTEADQQPILQYDFGKIRQDEQFQITRLFNQPPLVLLTAVQDLKIMLRRRDNDHGLQSIIDNKLGQPENQYFFEAYQRPQDQCDRLYKPSVVHGEAADDHPGGCAATCGNDVLDLIIRPPRGPGQKIGIHYGRVACGNSVVKDARTRDRLSDEHDILCFEMESAGLMNHFPCLVIRGICDYSDSHKSKEWQPYAAMSAAAYAWRLLENIAPRTMSSSKSMAVFLEERDQKILDWISSPEYTKRHMSKHDEVLRAWHRKTGGYLLDSVEFRHWIKSTGSTLFCYGDPGAGKTVIASAVIDNIHGILESETDQGLAYFYSEYKNAQNQFAPQILRSLLKSLGTRRRRTVLQLPAPIQDLYEKCQRLSKTPSDEELLETLERVVEEFNKVFVVLDAVDELPPNSQSGVCDALHTLQTKTGKLNILATSRRSEEIQTLDAFSASCCKRFEIRARDDDIKVYLYGRLGGLRHKWARDADLKSEILTAIPKTAKGMFLAARLLMDQIAPRRLPGHVKDDLRKALKQGIGGINQIYEQAMTRIMAQSDDDKHYAMSALGWMTRARRPLTEPELLHAIAIRPEDLPFDPDYLPETGMLQSICAGLITVSGQAVRFVHYTTQEFFDGNRERYFPYVEAEITVTCLTFLGVPAQTPAGWQNGWNPLHYYAVDYWMHHARIALQDGPGVDSAVVRSLLAFLGDGLRVSSSRSPKDCPKTTGLHLAAMHNLDRIIQPLMALESNKDPRDSRGRTPLTYAAHMGWKEATEELLNFEEVAPDSTCDGGGSPLSYAVSGPVTKTTLDVVSALLSTGRVLVDRLYQGKTPLYSAILDDNQALVRLLLDNKADPDLVNFPDYHLNPNDGWESSALLLAIQNTNTPVTKILLEAKANPNLGLEGILPLDSALRGKFWEGARLLLDHEPRVNLESLSTKRIVNALMLRVVKKKDLTGLGVLLDCGASFDFDFVDGRYGFPDRCPLLTAWRKSWLEGLEKIIGEDGRRLYASSRAPCRQPRTILHSLAAANRGRSDGEREEHVRFVVALGDMILRVSPEQVNEPDPRTGESPLALCCRWGGGPLAALLLARGATADNTSAFAFAAYGEHEDVIELLLEHGGDVNSADPTKHSTTALAAAASRGNVGMCRSLLRRNAGIEIRDQSGRTPLFWACRLGMIDVCRLLLDEGADIEARDGAGFTPLHAAVESGQLEICTLLLDNKACLEARDSQSKRTPLLVAVDSGRTDMCSLLLGRDAEIEAQDGNKETPFLLAARKECLDICAILLARKANAEAKNQNGETALLAACLRGSDTLCQFLLDYRADKHAADARGNTPFHAALDRDDICKLRLLITYAPGVHVNTPRWCLHEDLDALLLGIITAARQLRPEQQRKVAILFHQCHQNINATNFAGQTALHLAALTNNRYLCQVLLRHGADAQAKDSQGGTALLLAVRARNEKICECLLLTEPGLGAGKKIDLEAPDSAGNTALRLAVKLGNVAACQLLLDAGARIECTHNGDGKTLFDLAPKVLDIRLLERLWSPTPPDPSIGLHGREQRGLGRSFKTRWKAVLGRPR
ncbi:ankyrin repeat-containing domain protein [Cladorrhinum sp. PSN332]|nr:ankyrin repeat-containing domain protein [Cladorrhinum sp. PSN332]